MNRAAFATFALGTLVSVGSMSTAGAQEFTLGIVNHAGILFPLAAYHEGRWVERPVHDRVRGGSPWCAPTNQPNPPDLDFRPLARTWHLELLSGGSRTFEASRPTDGTACRKRASYVTDVPPIESFDPIYYPRPKIGYAFDEPLDTRRFRPVMERDSAIARAIERRFDQWERRAFETVSSGENARWYRRAGYPLDAADRTQTAVSFETFLSAPVDSANVYYFEVSRNHAKLPGSDDANCDVVTIMTGWIAGTPSSGVFLSGPEFFTDCDRKGTTTLHPFAVIPYDGKNFAIGQMFGWEWGRFVVYSVGSTVSLEVATDFY